MSVSEPQIDSLVVPSADKVGVFRCGICWSITTTVQVAVAESYVVVRMVCPICGNMREWQIALEGAGRGSIN